MFNLTTDVLRIGIVHTYFEGHEKGVKKLKQIQFIEMDAILGKQNWR